MMISAQEQDQRKQRIIHAAYCLFCEEGIDAVPMTVIAQESGISHASVYRYFKTKAELILCTQKILWEEVMESLLKCKEQQLYAAQTGFEQIKIMLEGFRDLYERYASYLLFASEYKLFLVRHKLKITEQRYDEMLRPVSRFFLGALEKGQADNSITKMQDAHTLFLLIWGMMRGFVEQIVIYDVIYDGENPWKGQFDLLIVHMLEVIKGR